MSKLVILRINCEMTHMDENELHPLVPQPGLKATQHVKNKNVQR